MQNVCIKIKLGDGLSFNILNLYCPPNSHHIFDISKLNNIINNLPKNPLFVSGDFNAHNIVWGCTKNDKRGTDLLDLFDKKHLFMLNNGQSTTVSSPNKASNALDLTFVSNEISHRFDWEVLDDPIGSNHLPTISTVSHMPTTFVQQKDTPLNTPTIYNFRKIYCRLYSELIAQKCFRFNFSNCCLDNYYNFCDILIQSGIEASSRKTKTPSEIRKNSHRPGRIYLPWWNKKCDDAINAKFAYRKYKNDITHKLSKLQKINSYQKSSSKTGTKGELGETM